MKAPQQTSVSDASLIHLKKIHTDEGNLVVCSEPDGLPFQPRRVYYLYDIPAGESRGGHGHKKLQQLIIAISGSFKIQLKDGIESRTEFLNNPAIGLLLPPGLWREITDFSGGSTCFVLASAEYDPSDYIRTYSEFEAFKLGQNSSTKLVQ